jgi:hypothetical protein
VFKSKSWAEGRPFKLAAVVGPPIGWPPFCGSQSIEACIAYSDSISFCCRSPRPVGELNTLIDELLVVVELLVGSGQGAVAESDVKTLIHFVVDCPQPNQVRSALSRLSG